MKESAIVGNEREACLQGFDNDGSVAFGDFASLGNYRQSDCSGPTWCLGSDFNESEAVDLTDLAFVSELRLEGGCL